MVIQRAECWWGAGERSGAPQQKRKKQKINKKGNIYIIIYFAIYIIPRTACGMLVGCGAGVWGGGNAVLTVLTPTHSPLAVSKSYFFTSHVFSGVHLFAYQFRRLSHGFRPHNIVDGTLTSGLRYRQHLTVL